MSQTQPKTPTDLASLSPEQLDAHLAPKSSTIIGILNQAPSIRDNAVPEWIDEATGLTRTGTARQYAIFWLRSDQTGNLHQYIAWNLERREHFIIRLLRAGDRVRVTAHLDNRMSLVVDRVEILERSVLPSEERTFQVPRRS